MVVVVILLLVAVVVTGQLTVHGRAELKGKPATELTAKTGGCVAMVGFGCTDETFGFRTLSIMWMTPLATRISGCTTLAELT